MAVFLYKSPWIVGWAAVLITLFVTGVHSLMAGTAAPDFGGRKATATCSGIADGFVYLGSGIQSMALGHLTGISWYWWPIFLMPFAVIGAMLAISMWNELPPATRRYIAQCEEKSRVAALSMNRPIKLVTIDGDGCLFAYTNIGSAFHSSWDAVAFAYGLKEGNVGRAVQRQVLPISRQEQPMGRRGRRRSARPVRATSRIGALSHSLCVARRAEVPASQPWPLWCADCSPAVLIWSAKERPSKRNWTSATGNVMHVENGVFSGAFDQEVSPWEKHLLLPEICRRYNVAPEEICHVGDHENDISRFSSKSASPSPSGPNCRKWERRPNIPLKTLPSWGG